MLQLVLTAALVVWAVGFALPFIRTDLTDPDKLDFSSTNWTEYQSGYLIADDAVRDAAAALNAIEPHPKLVYATWWLCHLMYFYADDPMTCLDYSRPVQTSPPRSKRSWAGIGWPTSPLRRVPAVPGLHPRPLRGVDGVFDRPRSAALPGRQPWRVRWGC